MTCRDEVLEAARELSIKSTNGEFTLDDLLNVMLHKGTGYKESTIRTHVTSRMCSNAPDNHAVTYDDLVRTGFATYRLR